jgi:hypothetical protein
MIRIFPACLLFPLLLAGASPAIAATFVYEGQLSDQGQPASGRYDLRIAAFDHSSTGMALAPATTYFAIDVIDGRFRVDVELPKVESDEVWFELAVREAGASTFSDIPGRSKAGTGVIGQCWSTTGDTGSNPALNFIGARDMNPFLVRVGNSPSLSISPSTELNSGLPITSNFIAGSRVNAARDGVRGATISGGGVPNGADPNLSDVGPNRVGSHYGTVSGGFDNVAGDFAQGVLAGRLATVGGGSNNTASGFISTVAGGTRNDALATFSSVTGGSANMASSRGSSVLGGEQNTASGLTSVVVGGLNNCAGGANSWAGGERAQVRPGTSSGAAGEGCLNVPTTTSSLGDEGTFVWADSSGGGFTSTGPNQFLVRAVNGLGLNTSTPLPSHLSIGKNDGSSNFVALGFSGDVTRWRIAGPNAGAGSAFELQSGGDELLLRVEDAGTGSRMVIARDPVNNTLEVEGNASKTTSGSWLANSDARIKTEVEEIDDALARLMSVRPVSFRYTPAYRAAHPGIEDQIYYNVIAQEFARTFPDAVQGSGEFLPGFGRTRDSEILQVDIHPALITTIAAVQELALRLEAERKLLDQQLQRLQSDNSALRESVQQNEARLARLEAILVTGAR